MGSPSRQDLTLPWTHSFPPPSDARRIIHTISNLRENWHRLHDIDRALAVHEIIRLGVSRRRLSRELGFSEGLFRHLLKVLQASPSDLELAWQNAISTNELVRRAERRSIPPPDQALPIVPATRLRSVPAPAHLPKPPERRVVYDVAGSSAVILSWLKQDPVRISYAQSILEEALRKLDRASEEGTLPRDSAPLEIPIDEVIRRCRPVTQHLGPDPHPIAFIPRGPRAACFT
jgi:hypothetical protein